MRLPTHLGWDVVVLIAVLLFLDTVAQIFFKIGVMHLGEFPTQSVSEIWHYCLQLALNPYVIGGVLALLFAFFTWLALIAKVDLSFAHPMTSLVYVVIPLSASWLLNEPLHLNQLIGILFIVIGVFIISDDAAEVDK
ncbi:MAG: EamA family transporter [Pseudomonadota bacterium]